MFGTTGEYHSDIPNGVVFMLVVKPNADGRTMLYVDR